MEWVIVPLAVVVFVAYTVWMNAAPARCPACRRINVFRRTKTGRRRTEYDDEGTLRRSSAEVVCGRCGSPYWIVRDDFNGCQARLS
jgi:hypothetical protein